MAKSIVATSAPFLPLSWIPFDSPIASTGPFLRAISCRFCKIPYERDNHRYSKPRSGVAQQDEWLIPGDGLPFVNDINLENAFFDATLQVLKGTACSRSRSDGRNEAASRLAQRDRFQRSSGVVGKFPTTSLMTNPLWEPQRARC